MGLFSTKSSLVTSLVGGLVISLLALLFSPFPAIVEARQGALHKNWRHRTKVRLSVGATGPEPPTKHEQGGDLPRIYLWDDDAYYIGGWQGLKDNDNGLIDQRVNELGLGQYYDISIRHMPDLSMVPTYVALSMRNDDAICISQVTMWGDNDWRFDWIGDIGYICGADWYYNDYPSTPMGDTSRCIWLDTDHSGGIRHMAMGMHMPDFLMTPQRARQYTEHPETVCGSSPRFQMYEKFKKDDEHTFYYPKLQYNHTTFEDLDFSKIVGNLGMHHGDGRHEAYSIDSTKWRLPANFNDVAATMGFRWGDAPYGTPFPGGHGTPIHGGEGIPLRPRDTHVANVTAFRSATRDSQAANDTSSANANRSHRYHRKHEKHLVSSDHDSHSAHELCNSDGSWGPDFVSLKEEVFCDMSTKHAWPLCDGHFGHKDACFDYGTKTFRMPAHSLGKRDERTGRDVPAKTYSTENEWRRGSQGNKVVL